MVSSALYHSIPVVVLLTSRVFNLDEADSLFVTESRGKKSKLSRLEEYDEDPGRAGSQKYRKLANVLETCTTKEGGKSKAFLKEFRKHVKQRGTELKNFWQEKEREFTENQETLNTRVNQLSQHLSAGRDGRPGELCKEDHPLFRKAQAQREDINSLLEQLGPMDEQLTQMLELPLDRWKQDKYEMKEALICGSRYGEVLLGGALAPELAAAQEIDRPNASEHDQIAKELFKDGRKLLDGKTWGHVAEDQLKQISAIVRMLPLDEE
ncbi:hypothetical protein E0Z10_g6167 [Xylaria hypoxylon]|uniref:Uncharacterized protein n=1 Tax=Xylaria hypoxylon TaxID=37992 RepID=A0A4Z0Z1T7_9PEZI|nr:hypothetical protein E0Z10_g6167 [Xylaria hypoxylon]